ncbi:hypothetical protein ACA910_004611 [Epithemia clementina (nom. ined.)]
MLKQQQQQQHQHQQPQQLHRRRHANPSHGGPPSVSVVLWSSSSVLWAAIEVILLMLLFNPLKTTTKAFVVIPSFSRTKTPNALDQTWTTRWTLLQAGGKGFGDESNDASSLPIKKKKSKKSKKGFTTSEDNTLESRAVATTAKSANVSPVKLQQQQQQQPQSQSLPKQPKKQRPASTMAAPSKSSSSTPSSSQEEDMNAGQRALADLRRQRAEAKNAELERLRQLVETDQQVRETPAAIPEKVAQRMGARMLAFVGLPLTLTLGAFVVFWYMATYRNMEFQPGLVATSTIVLLATSLLGITYSVMSASWDEDREGDLLGIDEFKTNLANIQEGLDRSKENARLRDKLADLNDKQQQK